MQPGRQLAEVGDGALELPADVPKLRVRRCGDPVEQGEQPALGGLLQPELQAAALLVRGVDQARAGRPDFLELGAHLRLEPRVGRRQPRGGGDGVAERRIAEHCRVVDERGDDLAVAPDFRDAAPRGSSSGRPAAST